MIQSIQRKMLRLIIQTTTKLKTVALMTKSGDDQSTKSENDMDSGVTFDDDSEKTSTRLRLKKKTGSTT